MKKVPVYLHCMLATSLPSYSLRSNNDISLSVDSIKTITGSRAIHSHTPSLWNNSHCLPVQPFQLQPSRNMSRHFSFIRSFSQRAIPMARWPFDVAELFLQCWYWTPILLSCHWAWLCQEYWHCINLIDWLIDINGWAAVKIWTIRNIRRGIRFYRHVAGSAQTNLQTRADLELTEENTRTLADKPYLLSTVVLWHIKSSYSPLSVTFKLW